MTEGCRLAVALEARRLVELRDRGLNPSRVGRVGRRTRFPANPERPVPGDEDAAKALKKRTLTNLYQRPAAVARRCARGP